MAVSKTADGVSRSSTRAKLKVNMEKNEIKKALYKQKPTADFQYIRKGKAYYSTTIEDAELGSVFVQFEIPVEDMGDADFLVNMEAKLLQRWIM